jgi:hypothetical protein
LIIFIVFTPPETPGEHDGELVLRASPPGELGGQEVARIALRAAVAAPQLAVTDVLPRIVPQFGPVELFVIGRNFPPTGATVFAGAQGLSTTRVSDTLLRASLPDAGRNGRPAGGALSGSVAVSGPQGSSSVVWPRTLDVVAAGAGNLAMPTAAAPWPGLGLLVGTPANGLYQVDAAGTGARRLGYAFSGDTINAAAVSPGDPAVLWVSTHRGVFRSPDRGATFTVVEAMSKQSSGVQWILPHPTDATRAAFGGSAGVRVFDGATVAPLPAPSSGEHVAQAAADPADPEAFFFVASGQQGGIWRGTYDGTASLLAAASAPTTQFSGLSVRRAAAETLIFAYHTPNFESTFVRIVRADGSQVDVQEFLGVGSPFGSAVVLDGDFVAVPVSDDVVLFRMSTRIDAPLGVGPHDVATDDSGQLWLFSPGVVGVSSDGLSPVVVKDVAGLDTGYVRQVVVSPDDETRVYAWSDLEGGYASTDGGVSFARRFLQPSRRFEFVPPRRLAVLPTSGRLLAVRVQAPFAPDDAVLHSDDQGLTFAADVYGPLLASVGTSLGFGFRVRDVATRFSSFSGEYQPVLVGTDTSDGHVLEVQDDEGLYVTEQRPSPPSPWFPSTYLEVLDRRYIGARDAVYEIGPSGLMVAARWFGESIGEVYGIAAEFGTPTSVVYVATDRGLYRVVQSEVGPLGVNPPVLEETTLRGVGVTGVWAGAGGLWATVRRPYGDALVFHDTTAPGAAGARGAWHLRGHLVGVDRAPFFDVLRFAPRSDGGLVYGPGFGVVRVGGAFDPNANTAPTLVRARWFQLDGRCDPQDSASEGIVLDFDESVRLRAGAVFGNDAFNVMAGAMVITGAADGGGITQAEPSSNRVEIRCGAGTTLAFPDGELTLDVGAAVLIEDHQGAAARAAPEPIRVEIVSTD